MPYTRAEPWYYVFPSRRVSGGTVRDRRKSFADDAYTALAGQISVADALGIFRGAEKDAEDRVPVLQRVVNLGADVEMIELDVDRIRVHGRRDYFEAIVVSSRGKNVFAAGANYLGVFAYDGHDFYIAPNVSAAKKLIEQFTIRDGGETAPREREVMRFYELGPYVVRLYMAKTNGSIALGRLYGDGTFAPLVTANQNPAELNAPGLDTIEDICTTPEHNTRKIRYGLGEPCYRMAASSATAGLFEAYKSLKTLHGVALVYDIEGVVLGRRVEFKYGSILPALGGLAGGRRGRPRGIKETAPRAPRGTYTKWHPLGPPGSGARVSYGRLQHREFEVTLAFENERGGVAHVKRYAQTFRRETGRGAFDVRLYDPAPGGGWRENYYERSTRAKSHEEAVKKVATARFARTERHIVVVEIRPLDQRPPGVGGLGSAPDGGRVHVETKWKRGGQKHCVVQFTLPGGVTHREPVGPIAEVADDTEIIRRALVTARPRLAAKAR